jgi:diguanylate cyclase (GGDEF)-like protein
MRSLRILAFLAAASASAQKLPPGIHPFRTYGTESGLGNLAAMRLAQDAAGFLWVATQDGVYRYDGSRFVRFGLDEGLPSTFVPLVKAAPDGTLWVGTYAGLAHFDGKRFRAYGAAAGLPEAVPNAIAVDDASRVWVATTKGLFRGSPAGGFAHVTSDAEATAVWFDAPSRAIWSAGAGGVACLSNGTWRLFRDGLGSDRIDAIVVDRGRRVWARSATHLWSKGENETAFVDETRALPATSSNGYLALDRRGDVWVPTDRGLAIHDADGAEPAGSRRYLTPAQAQGTPASSRPNGTPASSRLPAWRILNAAAGLPTDWARDILEDREGSIWVASLGIHRMLGRGEFTSYNRRSGLPNDVVWCFRWDRDGRLLVGTDLGLVRSTDNGWSVVPGTEANQVRTMTADARGAIWAGGTPGEIVRIDGANVRRYGPANGVDARSILSLAIDRDGALWAATRGSGLLRKAANEERFARVDIPGGAPDETFREVFVDSHGRVWGGGEHGLACLDGGAWRRYTKRDGLAHDHVSYVAETASGDLWVAYFEPLGIVRIRLRSGGALQVLERRGVSGKRVFLVGEDARRRLWVGTGVGVDVIDRGLEQHFSIADGLAGDDTDAMAFRAEPDGEVFIGTSAGFSHYVPRPDPPRMEPPPVRLMSAGVEKRNVTVSFAALTFFKEDLVEMQTRVVGMDDEWRATTDRQIRYFGLTPGKYRFEMRARLKPGSWSAPASADFTVAPAWWQTIWARIGALLLLIALIGLAFRGRVALLRRRNAELEALVEQRTRELAQANEKLLDLSVTDALTGMRNRRYLELCMPEYTADALRRHENLSRAGLDPTRANGDLVFLLFDLDDFKAINDLHGHLAGDMVLVELHELLRTTMRETDTLIRWGGEEFLFVARNSSRHEAGVLAERIRATVGEHEFKLGVGLTVRLTCSVGFAAYPFLPEDRTRASWEEVVAVADTCLYLAKRRGRNRTVGAIAGDCRDPQTLLARIRTSFDAVVAGGELHLT